MYRETPKVKVKSMNKKSLYSIISCHWCRGKQTSKSNLTPPQYNSISFGFIYYSAQYNKLQDNANNYCDGVTSDTTTVKDRVWDFN